MSSPGQKYVDPIYGSITIGDPFNSTMLAPALQKERKRLQGIRSLGLMFHFFPAGSHSKWEHYMGMYHVAMQLPGSISAEDRRALQWLCLLGGIGSLPLTHSASSSVLLAAHLSKDFKKELLALIAPGVEPCSKCLEKEYCQTPAEDIAKARGRRVLRCVFSAYKISHLPRQIDLGDRTSLIRGCICPNSLLHKLYLIISRYDYMQRDLYHTGVAKFSVGISEFFETLVGGVEALEASQHMKLLTQLYDYMVETLYLEPNVACFETLVSRVLTDKLLGGQLQLSQLLEYNDDSLLHRLEELEGGDFIASLSGRTRIFTIKRDIRSDATEQLSNPFKVETSLVGLTNAKAGELLTYPATLGMVVSTHFMGFSEDAEIAYKVMLSVLKGNDKLYPIASAAARLQRQYLARGADVENARRLGQEILSYALGHARIEYRYDTVSSSVVKLPASFAPSEFDGIVEEVGSLLSERPDLEDLPRSLRRFWMTLQQYKRKKQRSVPVSERDRLWRTMVRGLLDLAPSAPGIGRLWKPITTVMVDVLRKGSTADQAELIETMTYLNELISSDSGRKPKWVLPSVRLYTTGGGSKDTEYEVDVVAISLMDSDQAVEIALVECTGSPSHKKATDDYRKLSQLKDLLHSCKLADLKVRTQVVGAGHLQKDFLSLDDLYSRF